MKMHFMAVAASLVATALITAGCETADVTSLNNDESGSISQEVESAGVSRQPISLILGNDATLGNRDSGNRDVIDTAVDVSRDNVEMGNRPNPGTPEPGNDADPAELAAEQVADLEGMNRAARRVETAIPCVRRENILVVTNAGGEQGVKSIPSQYGCPQ